MNITFRRLPLAVSLGRLFVLFLAVSSLSAELRAQVPDNKGTEFILAFPQNMGPAIGALPTLRLLIAAEAATKVEISGPTFTTATFDVPASTIASSSIELAFSPLAALQLVPNAISAQGVRVRSVDALDPTKEGAPIAVWGVNRRPGSTGGYMALPVDVLGTQYRVLSRPGISPAALGSQVTIIGAEDMTTVTITPPVAIPGVTAAGEPFDVVLLDPLQTFLLQLDVGDLSGTLVTADKPVGVLGGSQNGSVAIGSPDHMIEQMPPVPTWGREFVVGPIAPRTAGDIVRVLAHESDTEVSQDGAFQMTLDAGSFLDLPVLSTAGSWITTSKPTLVGHYNKGQLSPVAPTDPFLMIVAPVNQMSTSYVVRTAGAPFTPTMTNPNPNRLNAVIATGQEAGLHLDGSVAPLAATWNPIAGSGYSYVSVPIAPGSHKIAHDSADVPFGISIYGHALAEGYGYVGGQLIVDQTDPVLSLPDNVTKQATGPDGATVTWDDPTATDFGRGDLLMTCTPASGSMFELGTTVVDCSATDPAGNTTTESFNVTVQDTKPPELEVPEDIVVHATGPAGAIVNYETSATDAVDLDVTIACSMPSGSTFPLGQTLVTCTATDDSGNSTIDTFTVTVGNTAPSCVATPSIPLIWPPNHQLVPIAINGATDPDGDGVTIRIDSIFQDEPTNDAGDGNTPVDGFGIGTSLAQVRAERSGRGNGRVYHIGFTATDSSGASCSGHVGVAVPHNQKRAPVDDGALYDSTVF